MPYTSVMSFPKGFFWGAATASYQVEGGIENCDWAEAAREGRVPVCGAACEHYARYESDFDIAKSLGHNCHRLSVEWARIEPEEGKFDAKEIEHYRKVLMALRARGLEPFVTVWHFTLPLWFARTGGFERKDAPEIFARYCGHVARELGDLCAHFATMNEAMPFSSNGWRRGTWAPFKSWPGIEMALSGVPGSMPDMKKDTSFRNIYLYFRVIKNLIAAHNAAYREMKRAQPSLDVGLVHQVILFHDDGRLKHRVLAAVLNWHWTHYFMSRVAKQCDSIGVNYYLHKKFGDTRQYSKTDMNWDIYPEGIEEALVMLKRYGKPLYVSEAGIADEKDVNRASYIRELVYAMERARERGADLRGYMYWSLLDNYEWSHGFDKRFGLVAIDYATQTRTIRQSAYDYARLIKEKST